MLMKTPVNSSAIGFFSALASVAMAASIKTAASGAILVLFMAYPQESGGNSSASGDAEDDDRHVIVLHGACGECVRGGEEPVDEVRRRGAARLPDRRRQA